jgi:quercetin dioxygenase-like cupin family protein
MISAITHHFSDNLYAKETHIPAGSALMQHKHKFSHLSIVAQGTVEVTVGDEIKVYIAPACIEVKKGKNHRVFALTDAIWYCVHSTPEKDVSKIDEVLIRINSPEEEV